VLDREIKELIDPNVTLECGKRIGEDFTVDSLMDEGKFGAVYLALGAHKSRKLGLKGEDVEGVIPAMKFLRAFNLEGEGLAKGRVGVIGGGNSAVDAARVALRLPGVKEVTIFYRRTREEMPAYEEEIEAALAEGVVLKTLLTPTKLVAKKGRLVGLECVTNRLGDYGDDGRRRPVAEPGTEQVFELDTLIAAIGEVPATDDLGLTGATIDASGAIVADRHTYATSRPGVFAGGDVQTGPNTVVEALASGLRVATMIDRYLKGEPLEQPGHVRLPSAYLESSPQKDALPAGATRVVVQAIPAAQARTGFAEVELCLSEEAARLEARRCLRCDLEFTRPAAEAAPASKHGEVA
jgi:NADH-quinone oxidoreductase subunit F